MLLAAPRPTATPIEKKRPPPALKPTTKPREAAHDTTPRLQQQQLWIVDHNIIQGTNKAAKESHINYLCGHTDGKKEIIQTQMMLRDVSKGRFIDLIRVHCIDQPEIICKVLNHFDVDIKDIKTFVDTKNLRNKVRNYLTALPRDHSTQDLLGRCLNKDTSIGQFCWIKTSSLSFFPAYYFATEEKPTNTVNLLRKQLLNMQKPTLSTPAQQILKILTTTIHEEDAEVEIEPLLSGIESEKQDLSMANVPTDSNTPQQSTGGHLFMFAVLSCFITACIAAYLYANKEETTESTMRP